MNNESYNTAISLKAIKKILLRENREIWTVMLTEDNGWNKEAISWAMRQCELIITACVSLEEVDKFIHDRMCMGLEDWISSL